MYCIEGVLYRIGGILLAVLILLCMVAIALNYPHHRLGKPTCHMTPHGELTIMGNNKIA